MKKVMFALAIAGMFSFAACNNNKEAEEVVDTLATETVEEATEAVADTTVAEEMAEETSEVAAQ